MRGLERDLVRELSKMESDAIQFTLDPLITELEEDYKDNSEIVDWIRAMAMDITEHRNEFIGRLPPHLPPEVMARRPSPEDFAKRYKVNCIVDNADLKGAPVVIVTNPTYSNLFGRIEKEPRFGALVTDFSMIRPGELHKANGGYLVIPTRELLLSPLSYPALKRALQTGQLTIEEAMEMSGFFTVKSLHPEPIPLNVKVITIGEGMWYHQLYQADPDFREMFKVKADFDSSMERTLENVNVYGAFICSLHQKEGLNALTAEAIAAVVDYSTRLADHQGKLSTRFDIIADVVREANFYAKQDGEELIDRKHIKKTLEERIYRSDLYAEKTREMIEKEFVLIDTKGEEVGQINGLSVLSLGDFSFGRPSRVTASVAPGRGRVVDIEREANLGGPLHTKGVLILSGYLSEKFADDKPLSLAARLVFEQSYGGVDGDSASSTELYALLSALSNVPIQQRFAVTGSVNQHGEVQAIGGVNQKIEGYFEVCKVQGLTGEQSVLIPKSNVQNLMLKDEVVEAVREGKFHIYPVGTIDEGIEILTGVSAGERQADGTFPPGTIFNLVNQRLTEMARTMREYSGLITGDN
jgi:lon-related putative ATP-dependent protease